MNLKRWLWIVVLAAIVVALVALGYRKQPVSVELAPAKHGPLSITVEEEGKTRLVDRYMVSAPVAGYAERIGLKVGDAVQAGQVVCWIQPPPAPVLDERDRTEREARVRAAEAAVRVASERVRAASADETYRLAQADRAQQLFQSRDVSKDELERTAADARRAQADRLSADYAVAQARADLEAAQAALRVSGAARPASGQGARVPVRAPTGGRVLAIPHESEGAVNPGQSLIEVGNTRVLEVEVEVLSPDAVRIEPGMRVLLERWGGPQPLEARVRRVEPVAFTKVSALGVEEQRTLILVTITSPEAEWRRLGDRYRVEAVFVLWEADSVLQVPASALFRRGERWSVFVVDGGIARRRDVQVGRRNALSAQILGGLKEGEEVIAHPDDSVEEGTLVTKR